MSRRNRRPHRPPPALVQLGKDLRPEKLFSVAAWNASPGSQTLVFLRCADGLAPVPSQMGTCDVCLAKVWISMDSVTLLPHLRAPELLCLPCWQARMQAEGRPVRPVAVSP